MEQKFTYVKKSGTKSSQIYDYFVVLDFEAVWNITEDNKKTPVEIIGIVQIL